MHVPVSEQRRHQLASRQAMRPQAMLPPLTSVGVAVLRRSSSAPGVRNAAPRLLAPECPVLLPPPSPAQGARYTNLPACRSACICSSRLHGPRAGGGEAGRAGQGLGRRAGRHTGLLAAPLHATKQARAAAPHATTAQHPPRRLRRLLEPLGHHAQRLELVAGGQLQRRPLCGTRGQAGALFFSCPRPAVHRDACRSRHFRMAASGMQITRSRTTCSCLQPPAP